MFHLSPVLPVLIGIGIVAAAGSAGMASSDTSALNCLVTQQVQNGMRTIQGTVSSPKVISGEYSLAIKSTSNGNSATISQGGMFSVSANEPASVGQMLINAEARYSVDFSISVAGQTIDCIYNKARAT